MGPPAGRNNGKNVFPRPASENKDWLCAPLLLHRVPGGPWERFCGVPGCLRVRLSSTLDSVLLVSLQLFWQTTSKSSAVVAVCSCSGFFLTSSFSLSPCCHPCHCCSCRRCSCHSCCRCSLSSCCCRCSVLILLFLCFLLFLFSGCCSSSPPSSRFLGLSG